MSDNGKVSAKTLARDALSDAIEENSREGGPRPIVLGALLAEARARVEQIQELVKPRKAKAAKEPA